MKELVELTTELMRFKTTADNPEEISKCANFIIKYLSGKGIIIKNT